MKTLQILLIALFVVYSQSELVNFKDWVESHHSEIENHIQRSSTTIDEILGKDEKNIFTNWQISTKHQDLINLTDGQIENSLAFGQDSNYFTQIYSNFALLATEIQDKEWVKFSLQKREGQKERLDFLQYLDYQGLSITDQSDKTINRLLIIKLKPQEQISNYQEEENSIIYFNNLESNQQLYYILYAQNKELEDIKELFQFLVQNIILAEKETTEVKNDSKKPVEGEKQVGEKPVEAGEKPAEGEKKEGEKPAEGEKKEGEKPAEGENKEGEKPAEGEKKEGEKPAEGEKKEGEKPAEGEKKEGEKPAEGEKKEGEKPAEGEKKEGEKPAEGEKKEGEKPAEGEKKEGEKPAEGEKKEGEKPAEGEKKEGEKPAEGEKKEGEKPAEGEKKEGEKPAEGEKKEGEKPAEGEKKEGEKPAEGEKKEGEKPAEGEKKEGEKQEGEKKEGEKKEGEKPAEGKKIVTIIYKHQEIEKAEMEGEEGKEEKKVEKEKEKEKEGEEEEEGEGEEGEEAGQITSEEEVDDGCGPHLNDEDTAVYAYNDDDNEDDTDKSLKATKQQSKSLLSDTSNIQETEPQQQQSDEQCVQLYSECNYQGEILKLCGSSPKISENQKNFVVKGMKVPDGVKVTFYNKPDYENQKLQTTNEISCLEQPLVLNLFELNGNMRRRSYTNVKSVELKGE